MQKPKLLDIKASEDRTASPPSRIRIAVGYQWVKGADERSMPPRSDLRWQSIKSKVKNVTKWVETFTSNRGAPQCKLDISIERLRGSHGQMLLENLRGRIEAADVLVMDIGSSDGRSFNPNVLLETGMAIALNAGGKQWPFILRPAGLKLSPSDLAGFLFTEYEPIDGGGNGAIGLLDDSGFQASLRSVLISIAQERGMVGPRLKPGTEIEGEGDDEPDPTKPSVALVEPPSLKATVPLRKQGMKPEGSVRADYPQKRNPLRQ